MAVASRFADDSLITMASNGVRMLLGLGTSILTARALGPGGRGEYAILMVGVGMMVMLVDYGIGMAAVYHIAQGKYLPRDLLGGNVIIALLSAFLIMTFGGFVLYLFHDSLFPTVRQSLLYLALLIIPGQVFLNNLAMMLLGFQKVRQYNLLQIFHASIFLILLLALLLGFNMNVRGAVLAQIIATIVISTVLLLLLIKSTGGIAVSIQRRLLLDELRYGIKTYAGSIGLFLHQRADVVMLGWWTSTSAVGLYSIAARLAEETWVISLSAAVILFPAVSRGDRDHQMELTPRVCRITLWATAAISLVVAVPAERVISLLFSDSFAEASGVLRILLIGTISMSGSRILQNDLAGRGRPELGAYSVIISGAVNIALNLIVIPRFEVVGAAWSTAFSYSLMLALSIMYYRRLSGCRVLQLLVISRLDIEQMKDYMVSVVIRIKRGGIHA